VLLIVAASWDICRRRIPNAISGAVMLAALGASLVRGDWGAALSGLGAALLTIAALWLPWLGGRIGGGDVKLTAAGAASVGLSLLHEYLLATALAGGVVALICFLLSTTRARQEMALNMNLLAAGIMPDPPLRGGGGRVSVPYGVAAAAAALAVVLFRKGW
jgi:prepilin peptidase CpaA